jgi:hypothetical protein
MRFEHLFVIHAIQLIARKNQHVIDVGLLHVADLFPHRIGGALVPVDSIHRLLRRQDLHKAAVVGIELVGVADMPMQADRHELRQHVNAIDAAVDAIGQRDIDQTVFAGQGHGRFGAIFCQRIESRAPAAAQYQCDHIAHLVTCFPCDIAFVAQEPRV